MVEEEQQLIEEAKSGNASAFGVLYDQYMPQIYRFVLLRIGGGREEAEDLTREVFVNAWQNMPTYSERGFPLSSWLYQIARNRIIDHFRTKKSSVPLDECIATEELEEELGPDVDATLALERVQEAIAKLGEEQQTVLIMRFVEDRPTAEVAKVLGKTEGAIRLVQHRALRELRNMLITTEV